MFRSTRRALLSLPLLAFALTACNTPKPSKQVAAETGDTSAEATSEGAAADQAAAPKIAADEATFEFGEIKPSERVQHTFKIKNEGNADLHIERVQRT